MNKLYIILLLFIIISCTLFLTPYRTIEKNIEQGHFSIDTFIIDSLGLYEFEYYSNYISDVFFFYNAQGLDSFIQSQVLYSEAILYPFLKSGISYFNEEYFFYNYDTIYIVIDNTDFLTEDTLQLTFTLDIYYKEE